MFGNTNCKGIKGWVFGHKWTDRINACFEHGKSPVDHKDCTRRGCYAFKQVMYNTCASGWEPQLRWKVFEIEK